MTTSTIDPEDLVPGNYVQARDGSVGQVLPDLDCLSPVPQVDRPEEYIAVAWDDGTRTAVEFAVELIYAGRKMPE